MSDEVLNEPIQNEESVPVVESIEEKDPSGEATYPIPVSTEEPISVKVEDTPAPVEQTAQIPVNEPISGESVQIEAEVPKTEQSIQNPIKPQAGTFSNLLIKAREAVQFRKRKKLDKIMSMFEKHQSISNDQVEKLLHISDATATRYLSILEKEGKIRKSYPKGRSVSYKKI